MQIWSLSTLDLKGYEPRVIRRVAGCLPRREKHVHGSRAQLGGIDSCIARLKVQGPSRSCDESKDEEGEKAAEEEEEEEKEEKVEGEEQEDTRGGGVIAGSHAKARNN